MPKVELVDADILFEKEHGAINTYFSRYGEPAFRKAETELLTHLTSFYAGKEIILAPGGGAVAHNKGEEHRTKNVQLLRDFGQLFYLIPFESNLEASVELLLARKKADARSKSMRIPVAALLSTSGDPQSLSPSETMLVLLQQRHPLYKAAAHYTLSTGYDSQEAIARKIVVQRNVPSS